MGERHDLPKIKPTEQPSMFNHDMGVGAWLGNVVGWGVLLTAATRGRPALGVGLGIAAPIIGGLWGGLSGKAKQEREQIEGRVVKEPGYWNKGILTGLVLGGMLAIFAPLLGGILSIGGAVTGSIIRKNSLQKDFDLAVAIRDQQQMQVMATAQGLGKGPQHSYMNSVTPTESATLAQKQVAQASHVDAAAQQAAAPAVATGR